MAMPEQSVVDVSAIGGEDRLAPQEPPEDGQHRVQHGQAQRDNGDGHRHDRRRFLRAEQTDAGEHEAEEEAPRVAEEDRRRMEIIE